MRRFYSVLLLCLLMLVITQTSVDASGMPRAMSPEILNARQLRNTVRLSPGKVDLNTASLLELQTLPGISESVALKIVRLRPMASLQDLYLMPYVEQRLVDSLILKINHRTSLPDKPAEKPEMLRQ